MIKSIVTALSAGLLLILRQGQGLPVVPLGAPSSRPHSHVLVQGAPQLLINEASAGVPGQFARIMGVVRLSSGRIVVANSGSSEVRYFSPQGKFLASGGRTGSGPGEFHQLFALFAGPGDSVIGYDVAQGFHVFSPEGRYARTLTYGRQSAAPLRAWPYGWFQDGSQLASLLPQAMAPGVGRWVDSLEFLRVGPSGDTRRSLFKWPAFERSIGIGGRPQVVLFGPNVGVAVWARRYCVGHSATFEFRCGDLEGKQWLLRRETSVAKAIPSGAIDRFKQLFMTVPGDGGLPPPRRIIEQRAEYLRTAAFARTQPFYGLVLAEDSGDLWVQRFDLESAMPSSLESAGFLAAPSVWDAFGPAGQWKATITLPPRFRPYRAGSGYVLGVLLNEDDVEQVAQYRIPPLR